MTPEKLIIANGLLKKIKSLELAKKEYGYALACLSNEDCKSSRIQIHACDENNNAINNEKTRHSIEVGMLIFLVEQSLVTLNMNLEEANLEFDTI